MLATVSAFQGIFLIVLSVFAPQKGEACDSSACCCVDSATVTQSGNALSVQVRQSGAASCPSTATVSCTVRSKTVCTDRDDDPSFAVYKSGKIAYVIRDLDDDACDGRLSCQSGACDSVSLGWAGEYTKTTQTPTTNLRCDPTQCCCAKSASATSSGSDVTLTVTPTTGATGCPNGNSDFDVACKVQGDLYMTCGDINSGYLIRKENANKAKHYVFHHNAACNAAYECTASSCMISGDFDGQYTSIDNTHVATTNAPKATAAPNKATAAPNKATAAPNKATAAPNKATAAPNKATAAPNKASAAPKNTKSSVTAKPTQGKNNNSGSGVGLDTASVVVITAGILLCVVW